MAENIQRHYKNNECRVEKMVGAEISALDQAPLADEEFIIAGLMAGTVVQGGMIAGFGLDGDVDLNIKIVDTQGTVILEYKTDAVSGDEDPYTVNNTKAVGFSVPSTKNTLLYPAKVIMKFTEDFTQGIIKLGADMIDFNAVTGDRVPEVL